MSVPVEGWIVCALICVWAAFGWHEAFMLLCAAMFLERAVSEARQR